MHYCSINISNVSTSDNGTTDTPQTNQQTASGLICGHGKVYWTWKETCGPSCWEPEEPMAETKFTDSACLDGKKNRNWWNYIKKTHNKEKKSYENICLRPSVKMGVFFLGWCGDMVQIHWCYSFSLYTKITTGWILTGWYLSASVLVCKTTPLANMNRWRHSDPDTRGVSRTTVWGSGFAEYEAWEWKRRKRTVTDFQRVASSLKWTQLRLKHLLFSTDETLFF